MGRCAEILKDPKTGLTPKQTLFTKKFLETGNATAAVLEAYPGVKNTHTAESIGSENLSKPEVSSVISSAYRRENINEDYVLGGLHTYAEKGKIDPRWAGPGVTALDRIGRFVGMFKDSDGNGDKITINLVGIPPEKLDQHVSKLLDKISSKAVGSTENSGSDKV